MKEFKIGDVVQLNSGSVDMTVVYVQSDGKYVGLTWYDQLSNSLNYKEGIPVNALTIIKSV